MFNDPAQRTQAVNELAESVANMALLVGVTHAASPLGRLASDISRARQATADTARFQALSDGAAASATRGRAPDQFQALMDQQLGGSPAESLFIPGETVHSLYQDMGVTPGADDGLLGFVPDLQRQLDQSQATGGDIVVPTAGYLTHVAGTDVSQRLLPDIRVRQDGMSQREAQQFQADYSSALQDRAQQEQAEYAQDQARREPVQVIHDDILSQARQADFSPDVSAQYATLFSARYGTRAERLGENPLRLYQADNNRIVQELPESIRAVPADALDAMIAGLRSGRRGPTERELHGPSLMEFLARRGGVEDQGGDFTAMGADAWHRGKPGMPRFVRPAGEDRGAALPGMGAEPGANRFGADAATLAAHEAGYLGDGAARPGIDALHEAVRRELAGQPVYSERNRNTRALDFQAAERDLSDTLDRLGIDPKKASNVELKAALNRMEPAADEPTRTADLPAERSTSSRPSEQPAASTRHTKTITRASLEAEARTGRADRPEEVAADTMAEGFHGRIADAIARGDQVVHVDGEGRETPLTSRDGRTYQVKDGAPVGWMGMLTRTSDRVELRPAERGFEQTAEPVARITGEEIAPRTDDVKALRAKARDYYAEKLRGTSVRSEALNRDVEFRGSRKPFATSANPDKLRLFAALPDVIAHGDLVSSERPRDPSAEPSTRAYHYLQATVEMDGKPVRVGVTVREDAAGNLYYNHNPVEEAAPAANAPEDTAHKAGPGDAGSRGYEQDVGTASDGVNLTLDQPDGIARRARGRIDFTDTGRVIRLFADRNLSTLLHEAGHGWLEDLVHDGRRDDAPQQLRDDMDIVMKWLGADPDAITTEQHEQFARGVEAYLMEGKAPSAALEGAFSRFKSWLVSIYRSIAGLRVELSPEIRQVMDRLLATDDEIARAQSDAKLQRLFSSAAEAGMTDAEFIAYQQAADTAKAKAETTLLDKVMRDVRRQRTAQWRDEAAQVRAEVTEAVDARPEMQAMELLRTGKPRGSDAEPVVMRMNRGDLEAMFGPGVTDALPRSVPPLFAERGGVHPDQVAEIVGLRSGDELVRKLMSLGEQQRQLREAGDKRGLRTSTIEQEVQDRMTERHGDVLTDGSIEEEAQRAIHNDASMQLLATEIRTLSRQETATVDGRRVLTGDVTPIEVARRWAARSIGEKKVSDAVAVHLYARAEAKAGQAAERAMLAGDRAEALRQKQAQMLNHALFTEAKRAADDAERAQRRLGRYADADTLPGMAQDALDQIHALLDRLDFGKASAREIERRQSLAQWVEGQRAQGLEPAVPDRLLDEAFRQHFSQMSMDDLRGLSDAVQSIAHLGRLKQKLLDRAEAREFDALVQEAVDTAGRQPQRAEPSARRNPGVGGTGLDRLKAKLGNVGTALRSLDASMLKMEQVFQWLDGDDSNGVFNRVVFRRLSEAQVREHDLQVEISRKLRALNDALPKQRRAELNRLHEVPELPDSRTGKPSSMTKAELLAVALNMGNEGNLSKMLDGEGWTMDGLRAAMDRHLSKADWDFVQGTWDAIGSLWPEIAALEKRVSGVEPEKVQPSPVETAHGTYAGGYYPLVYDPLRSFDVEQNRQRSGAALFENNYVRATTSQGHTISRNDGYARPLHLSLDVLPRHLNQVIHDLAYREAVMDADRFMSAPRVREAIEGAMGREYYQQVRPWLQSIANDRTIDPRGLAWWDRVAHVARTNTTMVGLGFRMSTMVIHGISAGLNSVGETGVSPMARAVSSFMRDPRGMRDFVFEKSGEMRNRLNEVDRDMRDALRDLHGDHGPLATVRRFSMMGVAMLDMASALPTWVAAHTEALKAGLDDADAIYRADQAVRNAHGAGGAKDHSAIQRGSETQKLFTMFYTFWNHLYNRQRDLFRDATQIRSVGDFGAVLARSFFYLIAPPIIHGLIAGGQQHDDGEDHGWAGWAAQHIALGLVSGIPVVRDVASAIGHGTDYRMSPAADAIGKAMHTGKDVGRALGMIEGEPSDRWVRHAIETPGYFLGLPTGQAAGAGQFLWDVWHGDEDPHGVAEWTRRIMYGPPPDRAKR